MKRCSKCGRLRSRKFFYKDSGKNGRLKTVCKFCAITYAKVYRAANAPMIASRKKPSAARRYAKKYKSSGDFTTQQWLDKCAFFGWKCYLCGANLTPETATTDHRKPMSKGGANYISNIAPACMKCNRNKTVFTETEAKARIGAGGAE